MKPKTKRIFAWTLLTLALLPLVVVASGTVFRIIKSTQEPGAILAPYTYSANYDKVQRGDQLAHIWVGYIDDWDNDLSVSLYPYSHFNAECTFPVAKEEIGYYKIRQVRYEYQFVEDGFLLSPAEFYMDDHWRELYEEDGKLYERRVDSFWLFNRRKMVCDLSPEIGFYDPISITGLNGCGIILLSEEDPGFESDILVYVQSHSDWEKARFLLPDGTEAEHIQGFVRRYADLSARYAVNSAIGKMELCIRNQDGDYEICQVTYSDGVLVVTPSHDIEVTDDVILNWTY